jgi:hypothetical protein
VIIGGGKDLTESDNGGEEEYEPDFEGSTAKKQTDTEIN